MSLVLDIERTTFQHEIAGWTYTIHVTSRGDFQVDSRSRMGPHRSSSLAGLVANIENAERALAEQRARQKALAEAAKHPIPALLHAGGGDLISIGVRGVHARDDEKLLIVMADGQKDSAYRSDVYRVMTDQEREEFVAVRRRARTLAADVERALAAGSRSWEASALVDAQVRPTLNPVTYHWEAEYDGRTYSEPTADALRSKLAKAMWATAYPWSVSRLGGAAAIVSTVSTFADLSSIAFAIRSNAQVYLDAVRARDEHDAEHQRLRREYRFVFPGDREAQGDEAQGER